MASKWNVLVEDTEDGKAIATVLELPSVQVVADTRENAIIQARKLLAERLAKIEIVSIEVDPADSKPKHPSLKYVGVFQDDPDFEAVQRHIQEYRDELDAIDDEDLID